MENKQGGGFFKAAVTTAFLMGVPVYFYAMMYTAGLTAKICFGLLMLFSFLAAIGTGMTDMSQMRYCRGATKLSVLCFPAAVNFGSLGAEIFLINGYDTAALICVLTAAVLSFISASVLVRRYLEDDF